MASLYRKWRSRSFDDLVGQEHVVRTLLNAVRLGRIAHAYLFTGPRGTGKTSTARILAKAVNCLHPRDGNPCNECAMCVAANEGRAMDVIEIDAASNTSVESVRDLRERVAYAAGEGRYKVYIVDEVHRLSAQAFDAFLKTLEEPPSHVIFVFASTEPHKVPATITSRCQRFDFRRIPADEAVDRMRVVAGGEGIAVADDALRLIALNASGSLRDCLGLLDQVAAYTEGAIEPADVRAALGLADPDLVGRLTLDLLDGNVGAGLSEFGSFVEAGGDPRQLTRQVVDYWRALLLAVSGVSRADAAVDPALAPFLDAQRGRLSEGALVGMLRALTDQEFSAKFNVPAQLPFEVGYVQAALVVAGGAAPGQPRGQAQALPPGTTAPSIAPASTAPPARPPDASPLPPASAPAVRQTPPVEAGPEEPEPAPLTSNGHAPTPDGDMESTWQRVIAAMGKSNRSLQAVLRSGYPIKAEGGTMTIGFLYEFHQNMFADLKKRKVLEEVIGEVFGSSYRVTCVRSTREEIEAARGAPIAQEDGFIAEAAERLRQFHGRELQGD